MPSLQVFDTRQEQHIERTRTYTLRGKDGRPYESSAKGLFAGHKVDRVYGRLDCPAAATAIRKGGYLPFRVFFADEDDAVAAGYRPCAACLPSRYADWRTHHQVPLS